jgi:peptide/nickel transport system substrate-binding protein
VVGFAVATALLATGCSSPAPRPTARQGGTIYVAIGSDPVSLNPLVAGDPDSARAYAPLFPLLYSLRPDLSVAPELAASLPAVSDGGTTLTLPLRADAVWSDGMPVTADDVVYTIATEMNPHLDTHATFHWTLLRTVTKVDDHTVRLSLAHADASFLADRLVTPIVPAHVYSKVDPAGMSSAPVSSQPPVSGGPLRFDHRNRGTSITLTANPKYFRGRPHVDRVIDVVVHDANNVPNLLAGGQLSWAPNMDPLVAGSAIITSGVSVLTYADTAFVAAQFNVRAQHVFADAHVRDALAFALDHDSVVAHATGAAQGYPVWSDIDMASWAYSDGAATKYAHNVSHARQLLQSAGWSAGADGVATKSGARLTAMLIYPVDDSARAGAAKLMTQEARQAGFALTAKGLSAPDFATALSQANFDAALVSVPAGPDPDDAELMRSDGTANVGGYTNPMLDTLIDAERAAIPTKSLSLQQVRKPIFDHLENIITTDLPFYFLWAPRLFSGFSATLGGVTAAGPELDADRSNDFYLDWYVTA